MKSLPTFIYEKQIWKRGYRYIAGIDEVGRGCFAGPVVAGAVVFGKFSNFQFPFSIEGKGKVIINDSKKLTKTQREVAAEWIKENCLVWGIGEASASTINRVGIVKATEMAFRKAIKMANDPTSHKATLGARQIKIDFLLIDAFYIPQVKGLRRKN